MVNLLEILTKRNSGTIAKKRLQFLLISDRAGCTPEILEMIKDDMIKAISKYMEIDTDGLEIKITQMDGPGTCGRPLCQHPHPCPQHKGDFSLNVFRVQFQKL